MFLKNTNPYIYPYKLPATRNFRIASPAPNLSLASEQFRKRKASIPENPICRSVKVPNEIKALAVDKER
jgi:hypothetical protein